MNTRRRLAFGAASLAALAGVIPPAAAAPTREVETESAHAIWGSCGAPEDQLVADYTVTEEVTEFESGRATLHLTFVGTVERTGTGVTGKYSERQRDFFAIDGAERYVGALGHLVVPGGRGFTFAGQARMSASGEITSTPGLEPLVALEEGGDEALLDLFCDALAGPGRP